MIHFKFYLRRGGLVLLLMVVARGKDNPSNNDYFITLSEKNAVNGGIRNNP